jgi:hypothetical protein
MANASTKAATPTRNITAAQTVNRFRARRALLITAISRLVKKILPSFGLDGITRRS